MLEPQYKKNSFYALVLAVAAILFFITAYNSHGFYHPDEHYQIVEFAQAKLGIIDTKTLAWEYHEQIRPTAQPMLCFFVLKVLHAFKIVNPYHQTLCLRLLTAFFALIAIHFFVKNTQNFFENKIIQKGYYLLSYFLWFIPFLSVRFSSETWAGLLFLLALTLLLKNINKKIPYFQIGILLGLSFLFRFQMAFALLGLFLWLFFANKTKIYSLFMLSLGFLVILIFGFCLDSWFYGEFVITPWNYFYSTILDSDTPNFGTSPWYFYLTKLISFPNYIVGISFVVSMIFLLLKTPKNIFLWCFIPFVLVHSFVPHKEERFIFPLAYLFAIILTMAFHLLYDLIRKRTVFKTFNHVFLFLFFATNLVGLLVMGYQGADKGRIAMTKFVYDNYKERPVKVLFFSNSNPYNPWHFGPIRFYSPPNLQDQVYINDIDVLNVHPPLEGYDNLLFIKKTYLQNSEVVRELEERGYVFKQQSVPLWIEKIYKLHDNFPNMWIYTLYVYADR